MKEVGKRKGKSEQQKRNLDHRYVEITVDFEEVKTAPTECKENAFR